MTVLTLDEISHRREFNYRRTAERRVRSVEEARAFVEEVGFCHFWPIKRAELPNLFHAIAGRVRSVPMEHDDPDISKCWGWKDQALDKRWWYNAMCTIDHALTFNNCIKLPPKNGRQSERV
jgi:hypothetical protein